MNPSLNQISANVPELVIILVFAVFGVPLLAQFVNRAMRRFGMQKAIRQLTVQVMRLTAYVLIFLALLYSLGFTGLAATISGSVLLVGVALGQAFRDLLTDVIAGFSMARDTDFNVGYKVQIGKDTSGVIKDVGLRKIRLIDDDGRLRILANSAVEKSEWIILDRECREELKTEKTGIKPKTSKQTKS
jgi:small-conductance mechanosensitive channel